MDRIGDVVLHLLAQRHPIRSGDHVGHLRNVRQQLVLRIEDCELALDVADYRLVLLLVPIRARVHHRPGAQALGNVLLGLRISSHGRGPGLQFLAPVRIRFLGSVGGPAVGVAAGLRGQGKVFGDRLGIDLRIILRVHLRRRLVGWRRRGTRGGILFLRRRCRGSAVYP